ncbi:MAG: efflux RND transporter periplasmic adaptor subunit [Clostridia bacterium]|nr:efflux RND transporter periplasmic adaptor subunit [Deltaproteobacteria bacterium]
MADQLSNDLSSLRIDRARLPDAPRAGRAWLTAGLGVAVTVVVGALAYGRLEKALFRTNVQLAEVALVSPMSASTLVTATGYVQALNRTSVGAKMPGRIAKLFVAEGETVKAGDVLVELESADRRRELAADKARIAVASAKVESAKANTAEIETQLARARSLYTTGAGNRSIVEDLEPRLVSSKQLIRAADAEVEAAKAAADATAMSLAYMTITAPIAGRIVTRPAQVGERVEIEPVVEIADFSSLVVEVDVPEARLGSIRVGAPAEIVLDAYAGERRRGEVIELGSKVNRAKATVMVRVKFIDDTEGVLPEMAGRVSFLSAMPDPESMKQLAKLVVPKAAVVQRDGANVVFTVTDAVVRMQVVNLGPPFGDGYEVASGLAPGTKLVRNPASDLVDGQKIKQK